MTDSKEMLQEFVSLVRKLSYEKRNVTLASGKSSDFYIDMKHTLLHPRGIWLVSSLIAGKIKAKNQSGAKIKGVGGLTMGADPLATGVSMFTQDWSDSLFAFYIRKEPKAHGTQQWVEGMKNFSQGDKVIILEDVVTTGGSTLKSVERAKLAGLDVVGVYTAVDRQEGGAENIKKAGLDYEPIVTKQMILEISK
ncbi:MAG: orotate phosphoribosyltransferase [Oligoflexia bacterium]|nr:orotate phosphoribosyltransferase [Oligoflexia bacterium]